MRSSEKACQIASLLAVVLLWAPALGAEKDLRAEPKTVPYMIGIPVFASESDLRIWVNQNLGPSKIVLHEHGGARVLVVLDLLGSGHVITDIYIFTYNPDTRSWGIKVIWRTDTSEVSVLPTSRGREVTFKSKSGKLLFRVPMTSFAPTNDPAF